MIPTNYPTLSEFRAKRDHLKHLRRADALPQLNAQKNALKRDIDVFKAKRDKMTKHQLQASEGDYVNLWWKYTEVYGQVAIIESDLAAIVKATGTTPPEYRAAVFTIMQDAERKIA